MTANLGPSWPRRRSWMWQWTDETLFESLLNVLFHGLLFRDGQWVDFTLRWRCPKQQVNGAVPWPMRC